jgi:hypothetical protein
MSRTIKLLSSVEGGLTSCCKGSSWIFQIIKMPTASIKNVSEAVSVFRQRKKAPFLYNFFPVILIWTISKTPTDCFTQHLIVKKLLTILRF